MKGREGGHTRKHRKIIIAVASILLLLVAAIGGLYLYSTKQLNKVNYTEVPKSNEELGIEEPIQDKTDNTEEKQEVVNLLLLGVDKLENASDSIIVLTIDPISKKIKLSSLMRDSYIYYGKDKINKLNYAYHYGGPLLSIKTVNQTYKMDIKDYIKVDFGELVHLIDAVGGINIDIRSDEISTLNYYVRDIAAIEKIPATPVKTAGMQKLNGLQAVAYTRIRYVGEYDFQRTERQRTVLKAMFDRVKELPVTSYPGILSKLAPYIETSLKKDELLRYGSQMALYGKNGIEEMRIPVDNTWWDSEISGIYYLQWNKEKNIEALKKFIYP